MAKEKSQVDEKNKKYKLFSAARLDDPNIKPVCAFFQSSAGCRNGANCKFAHTATHEKSAHVVVSKIVFILQSVILNLPGKYVPLARLINSIRRFFS